MVEEKLVHAWREAGIREGDALLVHSNITKTLKRFLKQGDTVIGKGHRGALVKLVERKSKYMVIRAVLRKTAAAVRNAVKHGLAPHWDRVHTITYDNGR